jgi:hypothetical protein
VAAVVCLPEELALPLVLQGRQSVRAPIRVVLSVGIDEGVMKKPRHQLLLFALKPSVMLTKL